MRRISSTAVIATAFGCPFEGRVPMERTLELANGLRVLGGSETEDRAKAMMSGLRKEKKLTFEKL